MKLFVDLLRGLGRCFHFYRLGYSMQVIPTGDSRLKRTVRR